MANNNDVVIVSAVRTPFGRFGGSLSDIDYYELGAIPMREVLKRVNVSPNVVNEVFWGVGDTSACRDPYTPVAARQSLIRAGLPHETPSISFDMACVSAMHAVKLAAMTIKLGETETAIAGGATSFGQSPLVVRGLRFNGFRLTDVKMEDPLVALGYKDFNPVPWTAIMSPTNTASAGRSRTNGRCAATRTTAMPGTLASSRTRLCPSPSPSPRRAQDAGY